MDLRRELGRILDEASAGERFLVERDRRPVAMIVSVEDGRRLEDEPEERLARVRSALDRLHERGRRWQEQHPSDLDAVQAIRLERGRDEQ